MKFRIKQIVFLILLLPLFISCDEDYDPFGVYREKFIMNSVLRSDTTRQIVTLSTSYNATSFSPDSNVTDPAVSGAIIKIWYNNQVRIFEEQSIPPLPGSRYKTPFIYYTVDDFTPQPETTYEIEALFPNGKRLKSTTTLPARISFLPDNTDRIPPEDESDMIYIGWKNVDPNKYVAARLNIIYFKRESGEDVRYIKYVPREYVEVSGEMLPFFPEPSFASNIEIEMSTFDRAMEELSFGESDKSKFTILSFLLEVMVYDENLTSYYASTSDIGEDFSINLDQAEFTNVDGGLGLFGSFYKQRTVIRFTHEYIRSFGYVPGLKE